MESFDLVGLNCFLLQVKETMQDELVINEIHEMVPKELHMTLLHLLKDEILCENHGIVLHLRRQGKRTRIEIRRDALHEFETWEVEHLLKDPTVHKHKKGKKHPAWITEPLHVQKLKQTILQLRVRMMKLALKLKRLKTKQPLRQRNQLTPITRSKASKSRLLSRLVKLVFYSCESADATR